MFSGDPLDARKSAPKGARNASILLVPERPDVGDDGVDVARSQVAVHAGRHFHVVADGRFYRGHAPVAPNPHAKSQIVPVRGAFGVDAMALRALSVRRLAVEDLVSKKNLLARSAQRDRSTSGSGRPCPAYAMCGAARATTSALALRTVRRDIADSS